MSKEFIIETFLFCEDCLEDTMHQAKYKDNEIVELKCLKCSNEITLKRSIPRIKKKRGLGLFIRNLVQKS